MKRPTRHDADVIAAAVQMMAPRVLDWLEDEADRHRDHIVSELRRAVSYSTDGYEIAKNLERFGYSPDADLVAILDMYWSLASKARDDAVRAWVKAENVVVIFKVGARVVHDRFGPGVVRVIREDLAEVTYLPDRDADRPGLIGTVVPAEDLVFE